MKNVVDVARDHERNRKLLERGHAVIVQCRHFRCMAYRDPDGRWRNYFSNDELNGDVTELGWAE